MYAQTTQIDKRIEYYQKKYIIYEILRGCRNRDFSILGKGNCNVRGFWVMCIFDFERVLRLINYEKNTPNLYRSVATLKRIPEFTFNPKERSSQTNPFYVNEYDNYILNYDLFFDFDKPEDLSWEILIEDVRILKDYLDEYEVPYVLLFSGNKGFQIIISGEYLNIEKIENHNVYPHKTIVENIKDRLDLKYLDLSNNGVNSKLCKIPYSLVGENIALPLSDKQFDNFNVKDMNYINVINNVKPLIRRGNLERGGLRDLKDKKEAVDTFIKLFTFK